MNYERNNPTTNNQAVLSVELGQSLVESRLELGRIFGQCVLSVSGEDWGVAIDDYVSALDEYLFNPESIGFLGEKNDLDEHTRLASIAAAQIGVMVPKVIISGTELVAVSEWFSAQTDEFGHSMRSFLGALAYLYMTEFSEFTKAV